MADSSLINFIKQGRARGIDDEVIRQALKDRSWKEADIANGFKAADDPTAKIDPVSLPRLADLFRQTWQLYKAHWPTYVVISAVPAGTAFILAFVSAAGIMSLFPNLTQNTIFLIIVSLLALVVLAVIIYINLWSQLALVVAIRDRAISPNWQIAFQKARPFIWPYIKTIYISALFIFGGFFLLVIPGIVMAVWFCFYTFTLVVGNEAAGLPALMRSREIVAGRAWAIFGRIIILAILVGIGMAVLLIPFTIAQGSTEGWLTEFIGRVMGIILGPFYLAFLFLLYEEAVQLPPAPGLLSSEVASRRLQMTAIVGWSLFAVLMISLSILLFLFAG